MKKPEYFDALEEFKAGRYQYSEALGFGKFDYCYFSKGCCMFYSGSDVPKINAGLPKGCFVPYTGHIWDWNDETIGKDWWDKPETFWATYIDPTRDYLHETENGVLITMEYSDILDRRNEKRPDDLSVFAVRLTTQRIGIYRVGEIHYGFLIPVFFTKEFFEANI